MKRNKHPNSAITILVKDSSEESMDKAIKVLRKKVGLAGNLKALKQKRFYESPGEKRRRKQKENLKKRLRREKKAARRSNRRDNKHGKTKYEVRAKRETTKKTA